MASDDARLMNPVVQFVLVFLCVEVAAIAILVAPWGTVARRVVSQSVSSSRLLAALSRPLKYFFLFVLLTWAFTTFEMLQLQREYPEMRLRELSAKLQHESLMSRKQRDFYLVGFSALLLLVVGRLYQIFKELTALQATKEALTKQAEQAVAAYKLLMDENEELKKGAKQKKEAADPPVPPEPKAEKANALQSVPDEQTLRREDDEAAAEEKEELLSKLRKAEAERDAAEKSATAMKKQAEGLSKEYARLTRDKESLENKLADFELLAGDAVKKSK